MRVFSGIYAYNYNIVPQTAGAAEGKPKTAAWNLPLMTA